jgi:hypothetical protein
MSRTGKHNELGFTTPESYFESLESRINDAHKHPQQAGFTVPNSYFESLEDRLRDTVVPQGKLVQLKPARRMWLAQTAAAAAAAAALLALITINGIFNNNTTDKASLASVEYEMLMEYLLQQPLMEETATLSYLYTAIALPENSTLAADVEDEVLIEYLINNVDDNPYLD